MADKPFNPEDPTQRASANAANRQRVIASNEASAAVVTARPPTPEDVGSGKKGFIKEIYNDAMEGTKAYAKMAADKVVEFAKDPGGTIDRAKADVQKTVDDAAIKPYQGATTVDRYKVKNPGEM